MPKHHRTGSPEPKAEQPRTDPATTQEQNNDLGTKIATVAAVGVAAALIEAELIPGILLGAAAVLAPSVFPKLSNGMRPLLKSAVRAGYTMAGKTRETFAEASEQFQDIVAEVKAEHHTPAASAAAGEAAASGEIV
jgi:hypothetical protein